MSISIAQIAVRMENEEYGIISINYEIASQFLLPMIEALSGGTIKVIPVPGLEMRPISEVMRHD